MSRARRYWVMLALLTTVPVLASASDLESESTGRAHASVGQIPLAADVSDVAVVAIETVEDPLLDVEFDEGFDFEDESIVSDPFENTNRAFLKFNRGVHRWLLSPITRGYQFLVPEPARKGVRRALINLKSPSILVNDLLQLRFKDGAETLGRFLLNSTIGMGGLFDVGIEAGWEYHSADFGQTLARVGVVSGPYLVVPVLGPTTVRDGLGDIVDIMFQPLTYLVGPAPNLLIGGGRGLAELDAKTEVIEALEISSVDYYAALRSAYTQNRQAEIELPGEQAFE